MTITRNPFVPTDFVDSPDPNFPQGPPFTAAEADELGNGIRDTRDTLLASVLRLNDNEFNGFNPADEFPPASQSFMTITNGGSWPDGAVGVLKTVRHRADSGSIGWDYQELRGTSGVMYYRHALSASKPNWVANTTYAVNDLAQPTVDNGFFYRVTAVAGNATSGAGEPAWRTDTTTFTDGNVTWVRQGSFWNIWRKGIFSDEARFTGKLVNTPTDPQAITTPASKILANARNILVNNATGSSITLNSTDIIADGENGQEIMIFNVGANNVVLTGSGTTNLRLAAATITLAPRQSLRMVFLSAIGEWIQTNAVPTIL